MSETNPRESDLILGGQNPPPVDAAILGGLAGVKQRLESESIAERLRAVNSAVQYDNDGINLIFQALIDEAEEVRQLAYKLLYYRLGYELLCDRLEEPQKKELFRILASDSTTQPQLLKQLSKSNDLLTLKNLAGNHNTPSEILSELGDFATLDTILNANIENFAALSQVINLNPFGYFKGITLITSFSNIDLDEHYNRLIKSGISPQIVENVKIACGIYQNITRNPNASTSTVIKLANFFPADFVENPLWYEFARSNPLTIQQHCPISIQIAVAKNPDTPFEGLMCLWENCHPSVYKHIALHHNIPIKTLEYMLVYMKDKWIQNPTYFDETRIAIAKNVNTSSQILKALSIYSDKVTDEKIRLELREAILEHPNRPQLG
jgi:hypothetical protein